MSCASDIFTSILYADDTTLNSTLCAFDVKKCSTEHLINLELSKVSTWLKLNKLSLNVKKTKYMIFSMPQKQFHTPTLKIENIIIEKVNNFNFLGIILNEHLNWKTHTDHIANKLCRTNGVINRLKHVLPLSVKLMLYNSLFLTHINYGLLSWGNERSRVVKLQKKKCILYVY